MPMEFKKVLVLCCWLHFRLGVRGLPYKRHSGVSVYRLISMYNGYNSNSSAHINFTRPLVHENHRRLGDEAKQGAPEAFQLPLKTPCMMASRGCRAGVATLQLWGRIVLWTSYSLPRSMHETLHCPQVTLNLYLRSSIAWFQRSSNTSSEWTTCLCSLSLPRGSARRRKVPQQILVFLAGDQMGKYVECTAPPYPPSRNPRFKRLYDMGVGAGREPQVCVDNSLCRLR